MQNSETVHDHPTVQKGPVHKGIYILPNLFTTASLFTGFLGLIWASSGQYEWCAAAILFSALMDGLDGKVAKLTNTTSEFGVQYDSLADLVAFGITPAFMMYTWQLHTYNRLGLAAAFLFATCGALRLARFNISTAVVPKKFFVGVSITASGCTLASFVFFVQHLPDFLLPLVPGFSLLLTICIGCLMVSRIRYYAFKEYGFLKTHPFRSMVTVIVLFSLIIANPRLLGFIFFGGYIIAGPVYTFILLPRRARAQQNQIKPQE